MSYKLVMWLYVVITGHNQFVDLYVCEVGLGLDPMRIPTTKSVRFCTCGVGSRHVLMYQKWDL